jgi:glycosyltransferase involved in cell wall biosynthesis
LQSEIFLICLYYLDFGFDNDLEWNSTLPHNNPYKMDANSVSVIIPAYNCAEVLHRCIESALGQSLSPCHVIVINDGSTDHAEAVVKSYGNRITYLEQGNAGQGAARNAGLSIAKDHFVVFLDADDYLLPDFLKTCVDFLHTHKDAVAVNTGFIIKKWSDEYVGPSSIDELHKRFPDGFVINNFFNFWAKYDHVRTGTVLIRREIIEKAGYQRADLRISQDLEYWGYIATFGPWGFIPKPLWVGDSASFAGRTGWTQKYRKRRNLCPSIEQWQERIVPRLRQEDLAGFQVVRGRVVGSFALNKILGGDDESAKRIVAKYGNQMPVNWSTNLMQRGFIAGSFGWKAVCTFIRLRELLKSTFLFTSPKSSGKFISFLQSLKRS